MDTERRASAIAGTGVFTTVPLTTGEPVEVDPGVLNHSCDPTLAWSATSAAFETMHDVPAGQELTVDYATLSADPDLLVRCHCETYRCRQMVTGDDWRIPELRRRYAGHFAPPVQRLLDTTR
jgi:SET domain